MKLITDDPQDNLSCALNLFFVRDEQVWVRGGGPPPAYPDVPLPAWMRQIIPCLGFDIDPDISDEDLGDLLTEDLFFGVEAPEGIAAVLYTTAWAFAELRHRLQQYEDLGSVDELRTRLEEAAP